LKCGYIAYRAQLFAEKFGELKPRGLCPKLKPFQIALVAHFL